MWSAITIHPIIVLHLVGSYFIIIICFLLFKNVIFYYFVKEVYVEWLGGLDICNPTQVQVLLKCLLFKPLCGYI